MVGPERARLLVDGLYDLTNRVNYKLRMLLMYVMTAVRVRNVLGARNLAHKISPGLQNSLKENIAELLRYVGWQLSGIDGKRKVKRFVRGEHDKGHRLQRDLSGKVFSCMLGYWITIRGPLFIQSLAG
jgi:hypothetical protein